MAKPQMTELYGQLPYNRKNAEVWLRTRALSGIEEIIGHWNGPEVSADEMRQLQADAVYHINKDWNYPNRVPGWGLMYHYAIGQSGKIYICNPETHVLWQANNANRTGLGILHILGKGQKPSDKMLASSKALLDWLTLERPDIPAGRDDVWGHGELGKPYGGGPDYGNNTDCPGPDILAFVRKYRVTLPTPSPQPDPEPTPFPTGFTIQGKFKEEWDRYGLKVMGYPTSGEYQEGGLLRQKFENVRLRLEGGQVWFDAVQRELDKCKEGA